MYTMADNVVHNSLHHDVQLQAPLPTPGDKGEPPSQWASSTINALAPDASAHPPADKGASETSTFPSSTATTPGFELPGAFPRGYGHAQSGLMSGDTQYVKDAAASALETAKGYVVTASETVGGYLPGSVAAYLPTSQSQHSDTSGVDSTAPSPAITGIKADDYGTLDHPESRSESETLRNSDADSKSGATFGSPSQQLGDTPDASTRSIAGSRVDSWSHTATPGANSMLTDPSSNGGADSNMRNADGTMKTSSSASIEAQAAHLTQAPDSSSHPSNPDMDRPDLQHHDETRNIPSNPTDTATTPDSKSLSTIRHGGPPMTTGREYPISSAEDSKLREGARPDALKGFPHESVDSNVATPGHGPMSTTEKDTKKDAELGVLPSTQAVDSTGHSTTEKYTSSSSTGTATTDTITGDTPKTGIKAGDDAPLGIGPTPPSHANLKADANADAEPKPKTKSGFLNKVRGEIKVLSGKVAHDQDKVEEGRRMMGKVTTGTPTKN